MRRKKTKLVIRPVPSEYFTLRYLLIKATLCNILQRKYEDEKVLKIFRKIGRKFYETFRKINYIQDHYTTPSFPYHSPSFIFPPFLFLPSPYCSFLFGGFLPRSSLGVWESTVTYRSGRSQKFIYFILFIYLGVFPLLLLFSLYVSSLSPFPLQYFFPFAAKPPTYDFLVLKCSRRKLLN